MLALAGEARFGSALEAPDAFSTCDQIVTLFHAAAQVTGDGAVGFHVGEQMIRQYLGTEVEERFRALGTPSAMVANVTDSIPRFTTFVTSQVAAVDESSAQVKVISPVSVGRHLHLCEFTRGLLSQVPVPFGGEPATVTESECQARGGRFCLYHLAWRMAPAPEAEGPAALLLDPETRIAQLTGQLRQLDERLEGVFSTASELLGETDIDTLLRGITSRAGRAVSATRYLLVVRTSPDADIQLHHSGFNPEEARALAEELWKEHPDDDGGARMIVDIRSSRRRYGRLAAVYPPGVRYFESERRMLALYAGYAATALDVVTALERARSSDATARALLGFSGALARATTTGEAAQLLADTVPTVLGCQHGTVMLWDPDHGHLAVRAETGGAGDQAAGYGCIVPTTSEGDRRVDRGRSTAVSTGSPAIGRMMARRTLAVLDTDTEDPVLRDLLLRGGTTASLVAPLFAGDEFLGVVAANFSGEVRPTTVRNRDLHERLSGLADQAVTALQNVRLLEQISHSAWHDALTGLPNRRLLEDRVEQELVRGRRVGESACLFFIDLDRFKEVNDTLGHAAGDALIREVGTRLVENVRRQDTVARLGGDEFAVLLPGLSDLPSITQLARRCLAALDAPFPILGREVRTSGSIGIAMAPEDGRTYEELLTMADQAMYRSKSLGRNTFTRYADDRHAALDGGEAAVPG
jgi:diguanylate cyclase (GGDEF)-like protein